jgi:hypothetical protein
MVDGWKINSLGGGKKRSTSRKERVWRWSWKKLVISGWAHKGRKGHGAEGTPIKGLEV